MGQAGSYELNTTSTVIPSTGAPAGAFVGGTLSNSVMTYVNNNNGTVTVTPVPSSSYIAAPSVSAGDNGSSNFTCVTYRDNPSYLSCSCQPIAVGCGTGGSCNVCPTASINSKYQSPYNFYCIQSGAGYACTTAIPPDNKYNTWLLLGGGAIVLIILIGIIAMVIYLGKNKQEEKA